MIIQLPKTLIIFGIGSLAGITLVIMIVTGILLIMQYTADTELAFDSVEKNNERCQQWMVVEIYSCGMVPQMFFFTIVFIHIFRGLYYGSYKYPRETMDALVKLFFC